MIKCYEICQNFKARFVDRLGQEDRDQLEHFEQYKKHLDGRKCLFVQNFDQEKILKHFPILPTNRF